MRVNTDLPRHVLHVLGSGDFPSSAIVKIVENLAVAADPARYQIDVCFLQGGKLVERLRSANTAVTCVNWGGEIGHPLGALRYAARLCSTSYSIIHQHRGGRFLTGISRKFTDARIVLSLHGRANERLGEVSTAGVLPPTDALIVNSHAMAEHIKDPDAVVIYPGVRILNAIPVSEFQEEVVIGTAGRLAPIKGLTYLLKAFSMLTHEFPKIRLQIAGDGSLKTSLEEEARRLGISDRVSFLGWRDDLQSVMMGWDIFVVPSLDEGFGLATLEAMAAGLPVVGSAVGGLCELVQDGKTGWLVPATSSIDIANKTRELILDTKRRREMGEAGRQRASTCFSVSQMAERTFAVYDSLF